MRDFASALVVSMVRQAMADQGVVLPQGMAFKGGSVDAGAKRALLATVLEREGPVALLRVADAVPAFAGHPVARIFAGAASADDVIARWLRIERYFHSRHRSRLLDAGRGRVVMEHFDSRGGTPTKGEDLVVAGLQLGLLRWCGTDAVQLIFMGANGEPDWLAFDRGDYRGRKIGGAATRTWQLRWGAFRPARPTSAPALDGATRTLDGRALDHPLAAKLFADIAADPAVTPPLAQRASELGMSPRTLQRRLGEIGWSLRRITAAARAEVAARLLSETETPIALVGLLAGYSDQPHFQREFVKALGPTPAVYRRLTATARHGSVSRP